MRRCIGALMLLAITPSGQTAAPPVPGSRGFTPEQIVWLSKTARELDEHSKAGRFEEAEKLERAQAEVMEKALGRDHWQAKNARLKTEVWQRLTRVPARQREQVGRSIAVTVRGQELSDSGKGGEALKLFREALAIREMTLGGNHPDTAVSYDNVAYCLRVLGQVPEALPLCRKALAICQKSLGETHPDTAARYDGVASCLASLGKASEALPLYKKAVAIYQKTLGETHPRTAMSSSGVAYCLHALGKTSEALPLFRKALAIFQKVAGENHPRTAQSYNDVAGCLAALGKPSEALPLARRALASREKILGDDHPDTAMSYTNVAYCLRDLGKASEALPLFRKALLIREKSLGENHPRTAMSYNDVAGCLNALGKASEALPLVRKALAVREKTLGESHPDTVASYNNVAICLDSLGKPSEALPLYKKALTIRQKNLGETHPDTATSYNNLAGCLHALGKTSEALPLFRKALATYQKSLGENHPHAAISSISVAHCLASMGKTSEALPLVKEALAIFQKSLGENHPYTAASYNSLAICLWQEGEVPRAVRLWQQSLPAQEAARFHRGTSGFDRAIAQVDNCSPRAGLAVGLARLGQPCNAFGHAEASLARGLLDDLDSTANEDATRLHSLQARLAKLDAVLISFASLTELTAEQKAGHHSATREHRAVADELTQLVAEDSARRILSLGRIQQSIPADAALVLWVDELGERWACVVRAEGNPAWKRHEGTGKNGVWTKDDLSPADRLYSALIDPGSDDKQRQNLLTAFQKQRLEPLRPLLKATKDLPAVKRLFVVPTGAMARIPAELLDDNLTVSYVPSGSVFARLMQKRRAVAGSSLLALGDPVFDRTPAEPPAYGVLIKSVLPGSHAAKAGLQPGDVLLSVGATRLDGLDDLKPPLSELPTKATLWRDGKGLAVRLQGAPLGAVFDPRSALAAVRAWRKDREALASRGTGHKRLPGTRLEVEAIATLVKGSKALVGSDASEQKLDELQAQGKLKAFKIIHVATHGETDERLPGRSAVILAQDKLPDPLAQAQAGKHVYDGRLTVSRIRERWQLDADLVVLSACETGLGKEARGDGLLGFAQAFLSKGARSVVLSRWKVDDTATALLMVRFYENLLGKRTGLKKGMGRATSLDEAKKWLRSLPRKEAERLATLHSGGVLRGSEGVEKAPSKTRPVELKGDHPYAHPYYWAAFTLVGDPD